jgi:hypothetical protein
MAVFFAWLGEALVNLILPASEEGGGRELSRGVRWLLHALLIALILALLYWINSPSVLNIPEKLPGQARWVQHGWLPILFLLFYALCWLGWWLWKLLSAQESEDDVPAVRHAWDEAMHALERQGIDLRDLPLILVLGRVAGPTRNLFDAADLRLTVKQAPASEDAPVHVWASPEAVFVVCEGCSLLAQQAATAAGEEEEEDNATTTGSLMVRPELRALLNRVNRAGGAMTAEDRRQLEELSGKPRRVGAPIRDSAAVAESTRSLQQLCRLIVRARAPYVPLNGVLLLLPFAGIGTDQQALDVGVSARHDLTVTRRALQLTCPVLALVCDAELADGGEPAQGGRHADASSFRVFASRFNEKQRRKRLGKRCPLVPDLSRYVRRLPEEKAQDHIDRARDRMLEAVTGRVANETISVWVRQFFALEGPDGDRAGAVGVNGKLFLFLHEMWRRRKLLAGLLEMALQPEDDAEPVWFGGCYVAGTGAAAADRAFVPGVFRLLLDSDDEMTGKVRWTAEAVAAEDRTLRQVGAAWVALAVLAVAIVGVLGYLMFGGGAPAAPRLRR